MPELPGLDPAQVRQICAENYSKGLSYFRDGAVTGTWRTSGTLHGLVAGSASQPYEVSAGPRDDGSYRARCTCPAARRQSLCKHAAALLVAWAEKPEAFPPRQEPESVATGAPKLESEAKRAREPKVDRRSLIASGLEKAESLMVDLCSQGLLSITGEQVETIGSLAGALEAHKLRRLARQVAEIQRAALVAHKGGDAFDERAWARLLCDSWFVLSATRKALEKGESGDATDLEELVGRTWLEKDLRRVENLEMVELAYQTLVLSSGFRVETSYLLELGSGTLYTEKQITPLRLKDTPKKRSYSLPLRVATAGIYPGFPPPRVKLIEAEETLGGDAPWDRAIELAEASVGALRQRLSQATANLVAPQEVYALFRPASVLCDGERIFVVDGENRALRIATRPRPPLYALKDALAKGPIGALFCRVRFADDSVVADPLGVVLRGSDRAARLARLTA